MEEKKTSLAYRVVRWLVWLFSPKFRVEGLENLPDEPCVIVGNHCHMYGPIFGELYTPGKHHVWCIGEMMKKEEVADYAFQDFWSAKPKWSLWFYRLLSHLITPLAVLIFNNAHTIPVYHDARLTRTYRESMDRLDEGSRIVIFPECLAPRNNIVHEFQNHFVALARFYHKRTGKALCFVPMYLAPALKTAYFGKPLRYDPDAPFAREQTRICEGLMDGITALALSLPEHRVVPYPNVSKKHYPRSKPLEVFANEKTAS